MNPFFKNHPGDSPAWSLHEQPDTHAAWEVQAYEVDGQGE